MSFMKELIIKTEQEGTYDITRAITDAVLESGVQEGMAYIYCPHTTAGVTVTENTDFPKMTGDMLLGLSRAFPQYEDYAHNEGNTFAHIKSSVMGNQLFLIISGAWPLLGPWQAVYFCEFDGPRERRYYVKIVEN